MSDEANEVTQALEPCAAGWIVSNSPGTKWRTWEGGMPDWTDDREKATRYARRIDAEHVHTEDEDSWRIEPYVIDPRTAASQASAGEGLRVLKGWLDWYRFATGDDDCEYLNDKGWDDAEALASTTMGVLAALATPVEASQPVGDAGEEVTIPADHPLASGLRTSQKTLDAIARLEQATISGYLALRDFPVGSTNAQFPPDEAGPNKMGTDWTAITGQLREISRISKVYDLRAAIDGACDNWTWRDLMDQCDRLASLSPPTSDERLRPMEAAPKDERYILAVYKSLDGYAQNLHGRVFAIRHEGETPSGYDLGWTLFPGHGGVPDKCFSGWMPLPAALNEGAA